MDRRVLGQKMVAKYFGDLRRSLRALELTRVYLDVVALKAFFDLFPES